jgi:predicted AAA+ superfamily ATPase
MKDKKSKENLVGREIFPQIIRWLKEKEIIIINGSRQVGKTTLLFLIKELLAKEKVVYVNFEDINELENFITSPKDYVSSQLAEKRKTYFLFDEFQYVNRAGKTLKLLYDSFPQVKFIVTGSSSLKIREIASFLVGRAIFFTLYPFSFAEYLSYKNSKLHALWKKNQSHFIDLINNHQAKTEAKPFIFEKEFQLAIEDYLVFGGYPAVVTSEPEFKKDRLSSIGETYIEKDIIRYLRIGNFLEFKNLAKLFSLQIGNIITHSSLAADAKISYKELRKFIAVFENTFIIKLLPPFSTSRVTEIKKSPKVFFIDLGLRNSLINDWRRPEFRQDRGAMIENFVWQNLNYRGYELHYWRTKQQAEVDFILIKDTEIIPIEVKDQLYDKPNLTRSFTSFINKYRPKNGVVLTKNYFGRRKYENTQIIFLPYYFV